MSKWQKIDPAEIKVGDRVKCVDDSTDCVTTHSGIVADLEGGDIVVGVNGYIHPLAGTWHIRKPKKAKPDSELADGHTAHYWRNRYNKQLDHNKQLEASNAGRKVKMQRLEKEAKDARRLVQEWESRYAVLAASINELPEEPTPPTRPDEPPVGSFFRVDRTASCYVRLSVSRSHYYCIDSIKGEPSWCSWDDITEPGDTITMLELREVGK